MRLDFAGDQATAAPHPSRIGYPRAFWDRPVVAYRPSLTRLVVAPGLPAPGAGCCLGGAWVSRAASWSVPRGTCRGAGKPVATTSRVVALTHAQPRWSIQYLVLSFSVARGRLAWAGTRRAARSRAWRSGLDMPGSDSLCSRWSRGDGWGLVRFPTCESVWGVFCTFGKQFGVARFWGPGVFAFVSGTGPKPVAHASRVPCDTGALFGV